MEIPTAEAGKTERAGAPVAEQPQTEAPAEPCATASVTAPEPPRTDEPPVSEPSKDQEKTRRARRPRKKSGDTSATEQRLSELLGFDTN